MQELVTLVAHKKAHRIQELAERMGRAYVQGDWTQVAVLAFQMADENMELGELADRIAAAA